MKMLYLQTKVMTAAERPTLRPHGLLVHDLPLFLLWACKQGSYYGNYESSFKLNYSPLFHCCIWLDRSGRNIFEGGELHVQDENFVVAMEANGGRFRTHFLTLDDIAGKRPLKSGVRIVPLKDESGRWEVGAGQVLADIEGVLRRRRSRFKRVKSDLLRF